MEQVREPPIMYRLAVPIRVKRARGVFWTLTFVPFLPHSDPTLEARHIVVTVPESRYEALGDHGPNFTRDEIAALESPRTIRDLQA